MIARIWRRRRAHILIRAILPFLGPRQPQPGVSRAAVRAGSRTRFFQQRSARIGRARSVPTATPLVRKRVVVETTLVSRSRVAARLRRRKPLLLRAPMATVFPSRQTIIVARNRRAARVRSTIRAHVRIIRSIVFAPPARQPVVSKTRVSQRARYMRRHRPLVLRAPVIIPLAAIPRRPVVSRTRRALYVRAYFGRRRARIIRSSAFSTPTVRVKVAIAVKSRRAPIVAHGRRSPTILRGVSTPTATPLVRKRLTLETQTGNRPKVAARARHRQAFVVRPRSGVAATISTHFFGPPNPGQDSSGSSYGSAYYGESSYGDAGGHGVTGTVSAAMFGPANPRRG
jgi:hypothetical protein